MPPKGLVDPTDGLLEAGDDGRVANLVQNPIVDEAEDLVWKMLW